MSQLIDKLNQIARGAPQPMGFRTAHAASTKPQILLIACLNQVETTTSPTNYAGSADAVLLRIAQSGSGTGAITKIAQSLQGIPWGRWSGDTSQKQIAQITKAGDDFIVFPLSSAVLTTSQDDKLGKILQIETSLSEGMLKAVNELPVDAVLTTDEQKGDYPLTWHSLMLFQHLASLLAKPLLVTMPISVTPDELKALWEAGIDGVVVAASTSQDMERLPKLREAIDGLNFLPPRKRGRATALLPHIGGEMETAVEAEEEEEE